jgi:glycosyltransferase involved in cell wall biosynthesis
LDIAIRAFNKAIPQIPNAYFWILGEGSERSSLEQLARDLDINEKVKFLGVHPHQDMVEWLSKCDVGVLPTRQDNFLDLSFSNKLPEYIIMGKPVIVSRLKTIRYYFSEEALAFFEPHNEEDLAQQMIHIYNTPELRQSLVRKASIEYQSINWKVMKERYLSLIDRITA